MSYSIEEGNTTVTDLSRAHSVNDPDDAAFKAGRDAAAPYATSHLLTSIQDPDYLDLTNNGPSLDDLGGFTIFRYTQQFGSSDKERWRELVQLAHALQRLRLLHRRDQRMP
ncbi:MAG: hypothetical protein IPN38_12565 [Flavobacteriales bacterium]|nr:hypothetical protein [Flavobacteriales bacterium]